MLDEFQSIYFRVLDLWNNYKALHVCYNVQVMVANVRCEEIANENLAKLASNEVLGHSFSFVRRYLVTVLVLFRGTWSLFVKYSFDLFYHFQDWLELEEVVQSGPVLGFGKKISSFLEKYFSE